MENSFSISPFSQRQEANLDIIFIHGLTGSSLKTWGDPPDWLNWIAEETNANVFVADYPSSFLQARSEFSLLELARLLNDAIDTGDFASRPLAFVVHSLGGVVLKKALAISAADGGSLVKATKYVCFIATPHRGSGIANIAERILTGFTSGFIRKLLLWSEELDELAHVYRDLAVNHDIETSAFYEKPRGLDLLIVNHISANPDVANCTPIAVAEGHAAICKVTSKSATVFTHTRKRLQRLSTKFEVIFKEASRYSFNTTLAKQDPKLESVGRNKFLLNNQINIYEHIEWLDALNAYASVTVPKVTFQLDGQNCAISEINITFSKPSSAYVHARRDIDVKDKKHHQELLNYNIAAQAFSDSKLDLYLLANKGSIHRDFVYQGAGDDTLMQNLLKAVGRVLLSKDDEQLQRHPVGDQYVLEHISLEHRLPGKGR